MCHILLFSHRYMLLLTLLPLRKLETGTPSQILLFHLSIPLDYMGKEGENWTFAQYRNICLCTLCKYINLRYRMHWLHVPLLKGSKLSRTMGLNPQSNCFVLPNSWQTLCFKASKTDTDMGEGERKTQSTKLHSAVPNLVFQPVTCNIHCQITSSREYHFLRLITHRFAGSLLVSPDVKEYILFVRYIIT